MGDLTAADLLWFIPAVIAGSWAYGFMSAAWADYWREGDDWEVVRRSLAMRKAAAEAGANLDKVLAMRDIIPEPPAMFGCPKCQGVMFEWRGDPAVRLRCVGCGSDWEQDELFREATNDE